jgi:peroxiredoxin Q/BCP
MAAIMTNPAAQRLSAISYKLTLAAAMMLAGGFGPMMKMFVMSAAFGIATVAMSAQTPQTPPADTGLKAGDRAPDFELKGSDGKTWRLRDLKGKTVVIAWFPKAFTGG